MNVRRTISAAAVAASLTILPLMAMNAHADTRRTATLHVVTWDPKRAFDKSVTYGAKNATDVKAFGMTYEAPSGYHLVLYVTRFTISYDAAGKASIKMIPDNGKHLEIPEHGRLYRQDARSRINEIWSISSASLAKDATVVTSTTRPHTTTTTTRPRVTTTTTRPRATTTTTRPVTHPCSVYLDGTADFTRNPKPTHVSTGIFANWCSKIDVGGYTLNIDPEKGNAPVIFKIKYQRDGDSGHWVTLPDVTITNGKSTSFSFSEHIPKNTWVYIDIVTPSGPSAALVQYSVSGS